MQGPAFCQYFIQKKGRWDTDSDSGKGPSIYTKSSTISEVSYCIPLLIRGIVLCDYSCISLFSSACILGSSGQRAEGIGL